MNRIDRLKAAAFHDVTPATPAISNIQTMAYGSSAMHFEAGDITVYVSAQKDFLIIRGSDCGDAQIEGHELGTVIALLTEARKIMQGGSDG